MKKFYKHLLILITILNFFYQIYSFDRSFFYRASSFWDEPRFDRNWLTTINTQIAGGTTSCSRNGCSDKVPLFGLYGPESLLIGQDYRKIMFTGYFDIFEVNLNIYQNFTNGLFLHVHVPAVSAQIFPDSCKEYNRDCSLFSRFKQRDLIMLKDSLKGCDLSLRSIRNRGFSDTSVFLGWTINYEDTNYLDYIDGAFQLGALFPTGKKKNPHLVFDIPFGYGGHYGITWLIDIAIGGYDWLTFGIHNDGVGFFDTTQCISIRTQESKTGIIRLEKAITKIKSGPVYRTGAYIKADHVCWGLSILTGFSFEQKDKSKIICLNSELSKNIANNDEILKKWNRWNLNILAEYDFAKYNRLFNPFVSILYNYTITGKRIFTTNMIGGYFGFNIDWCF